MASITINKVNQFSHPEATAHYNANIVKAAVNNLALDNRYERFVSVSLIRGASDRGASDEINIFFETPDEVVGLAQRLLAEARKAQRAWDKGVTREAGLTPVK